VSKFVTGGTRDSVATMRQSLADDSKATQTMGVATLDALRSAAKIDSAGNGNFSSPGFNAALESLSPKLGSLLPRQTTEQLQNLGNVARYTQFQPRGSYVNNSNTLTAAGDFGAHVAEHAVNSAAHGLPLGTAGRILLGGFSKAREARAALAPGAGLNRMDLLRSAINAGGTP